jgi:hypothetical protein
LDNPGTPYLPSWTFDSASPPAPTTGPFNSISCSFNNEIATIGFVSAGAVPLGTSTINHVYQDVASLAGAPTGPDIYSYLGGVAAPNVRGIISGTSLIASGSATLAAGELIYAADIAACSPSVLGCPAISTGGSPQATGAGSVATTCAVVGGVAEVTVNVATPHNLLPGETFFFSGLLPAGFNDIPNNPAYTVLPATTSTVLVGTNGATCPAAVATQEGLGNYAASAFPLGVSANVGRETLEGFINDASGTWSITSGVLTVPSQTLNGGDFVYGAGVVACATAPTSYPKVQPTATGTAFSLTGSVAGFISGTNFTVTTAATGESLVVGQELTGPSVTSGTTLVSGSGSAWVVSISQTVGSLGSPVTMANFPPDVAAETMNTLQLADSFNGTINNASPGAIASGNQLLPSASLLLLTYITASDVTGCAGPISLGGPTITGPYRRSGLASHCQRAAEQQGRRSWAPMS